MEDCRACAWDGYCIPDECIGIQKSAGTCANRIPAKKIFQQQYTTENE